MMSMKKTVKYGLAASLSLAFALTASAQTISLSFQGRTSANSGPTDPLAATEVAGVLPVANWNNIDNHNGGNGETLASANNGESAPLVNSTGGATPVTLHFAGNDSWNNDAPPTVTTPNARMMNGLLKRQQAGTSGSFTFTNLADAQYDVYVYYSMNGDNVRMDLSDGNSTKTFYVIETHAFTDTSSFIEAKSTNPAGPYEVGNYSIFKSLPTYGGSTITINFKYISGADGNGISGAQIVRVGDAVGIPPAPSLVSSPSRGRYLVGDTPTLSGTIAGAAVNLQWFKNDVLIAGATSSTYTLPALTAADDGARFFLRGNNVSGTANTATAVITIGKLVLGSSVKREFFAGRTKADLEGDPTLVPTSVSYLPSFDMPVNTADNYATRASTIFIAPTTGNYVFFVNSDDASDLYVSTDATPANKVLVASELVWNPARNWVANDRRGGGPDLNENRSDVTLGTISMVAGKKYYMEALHVEGGGGDNLGATFKLATGADPVNGDASKLTGSVIEGLILDGNIVEFTTQPTPQTAQENRRAIFTTVTKASQVGGDIVPPTFYLWQSKASGAGSFTDIGGATKSSYTTPLLSVANNGTIYRLVASVIGFATNSTEVALTVIADTFAPLISGSGSVKNGAGAIEIGLGFDEELDAVTAAAAGNYQISKGTISSVRFHKYATTYGAVSLATTGIAAGDSVTVTVTGVKDLKGNTMPATTETLIVQPKLTRGRVGGTDYIDVLGEAADLWPTDAVAVDSDDSDYTLTGGGSADWGTYEELSFAYETIAGDFDKIVRVEHQDPTSQWARAGMMARAALDLDKTRANIEGGYVMSRNIQLRVNPTTQWNGDGANNAYEFIYRAADASSQYAGPGGGNPEYPNAWMRLQRVGQMFTGYRGNDGVTWTEVGTYTFFNDVDGTGFDGTMPTNVFVGLFYGPEFGNNGTKDGVGHSAHVRFHSYGDFGVIPATPAINSVTLAGGNVTITYSGGTLQSTTSLVGPIVWTDEGSTGTFTGPVTSAEKYFRVRK